MAASASLRLAAGLLVVAVAAGCTAGQPPAPAPSRQQTSTSPTPTAATPTPTGSATTVATSPIGGLPTAAELSTARADVARLSTRDLAGQLVVARYAGTAPAAAAALVGRLHLGGVAVFAGNVPTATAAVVPTLREVARAATAALAGQGRRWPAFLAVDQEGGPVTRVGAPATAFPAAMALGAAGGDVLARQVGAASGAELAAMGFTVVLAPDADVTIGPSDPTIGVRSPGGDPRLVARVAVGLARGYAEAGLVPVAKHFPGHGSVTTDSHLGLPRQARSVTVLERRDLVPFRALVDQGAPAVMTAHIVVTGLDDARPASLSRGVTTGLLRERLGFTGLVVTDALEMDAVTAGYGAGRAAVLAVQAGADVLLMPADPGAAVDALVTAVDRRQLTRTRLVDSAARMVATLRHAARRTRSRPSPGTVGSHRGTARALADAAVTVVSGPCRGRLVGSAISVTGALSADRGGLAAAALRAGLHVGGGTQVRLLGGGVYNAGSRSASGSETGSGDVVVALDVPYGLARSSARTARLAAYGRTSATFDAVVAVLLGRQPARGHLPVPVGDHKIGTGC